MLLCNEKLTKKISDFISSMLRGMSIHYYDSSDDEHYKSIIDNINGFKNDYKLSENFGIFILGLIYINNGLLIFNI